MNQMTATVIGHPNRSNFSNLIQSGKSKKPHQIVLRFVHRPNFSTFGPHFSTFGPQNNTFGPQKSTFSPRFYKGL